MSRRHKIWARRKLTHIRTVLGNHCKECGLTQDDTDLEIDCIEPCGDRHHKMSTDQRASFYTVQLLLNNCQLLCKKCHDEKTKKDNQHFDATTTNQPNSDNEPF